MKTPIHLILPLDRWRDVEVINTKYERIQIMAGQNPPENQVLVGWATIHQTQNRLQVTADIFHDCRVTGLAISTYVLTGRRLYITSFQANGV